jgi:hypothetical protein
VLDLLVFRNRWFGIRISGLGTLFRLHGIDEPAYGTTSGIKFPPSRIALWSAKAVHERETSECCARKIDVDDYEETDHVSLEDSGHPRSREDADNGKACYRGR